jgi:hypothetical protein
VLATINITNPIHGSSCLMVIPFTIRIVTNVELTLTPTLVVNSRIYLVITSNILPFTLAQIGVRLDVIMITTPPHA